MSGAFICVGDTHSHGGQVTGGAPNSRSGDRAIARMGDPAICEIHGETTIATVSGKVRFSGMEAACDGDLLACGGVLFASQNRTRSLIVSAAEAVDSAMPTQPLAPQPSSPVESLPSRENPTHHDPHDEHFVVVNAQKEPLNEVVYRLEPSQGTCIQDQLDDHGCTKRHPGPNAEPLLADLAAPLPFME